MTQEKLKEILDKHNRWLNDEVDGERADFNGADLRDADLRWANLVGADFSDSNLIDANLRGANLCYADLRYTDLRYTDFTEATLRDANFRGADLTGADLRYANLVGADLRGADLTNADYTGTILNLQCSEEGSFIAWKKLVGGSIAKLLIPEDAKRSSATTRKCRASKAIVLAIYDKNGEEISEGRSRHDYEFIYRVGETIYPDSWNEDRWNECSGGIHFFVTRKEAEEY